MHGQQNVKLSSGMYSFE